MDMYLVKRRDAYGVGGAAWGGKPRIAWGKWRTVVRVASESEAKTLMENGSKIGGMIQWSVVYRSKRLHRIGA